MGESRRLLQRCYQCTSRISYQMPTDVCGPQCLQFLKNVNAPGGTADTLYTSAHFYWLHPFRLPRHGKVFEPAALGPHWASGSGNTLQRIGDWSDRSRGRGVLVTHPKEFESSVSNWQPQKGHKGRMGRE